MLDAGKIHAGIDQFADPPQAGQVVGAVAAGAAVTADRTEQAVALIEPQRLHRDAGKFGGDRNPVDPVAGRGLVLSVDRLFVKIILGNGYRKYLYHTCDLIS